MQHRDLPLPISHALLTNHAGPLPIYGPPSIRRLRVAYRQRFLMLDRVLALQQVGSSAEYMISNSVTMSKDTIQMIRWLAHPTYQLVLPENQYMARLQICNGKHAAPWIVYYRVSCLVYHLFCVTALLDVCHLSVNATTSEHVQTTIKFYRKNNIRMSIKNTGSDYLGRSFSGGSLALWTHNLKNMEYYQTFILSNCNGKTY